jgi:starch synthase
MVEKKRSETKPKLVKPAAKPAAKSAAPKTAAAKSSAAKPVTAKPSADMPFSAGDASATLPELKTSAGKASRKAPSAKASAPTSSSATPSSAARSSATRSSATRAKASPSPKPADTLRSAAAAGAPVTETPAANEPQAPVEPPLSVLMIAPEFRPYVRNVGLAQLASALPGALGRLGHRVTLVLPKYRGTDLTGAQPLSARLELGDRAQHITFHTLPARGGVTTVFVEVPDLFDRDDSVAPDGTDSHGNAWRFAVFNRAALEYARLKGERPSVIHAHDWQTGLVPVFQKMHLSGDPVLGGVPAVFTIHDIAAQGVFPASLLPALGLGWEVLDLQALEYWGQISYLKGGINFSEKITTAGRDAREVLTPELGCGMEGVLARRANALTGTPPVDEGHSWDASALEYVKVYRGAERPAAG